MPLKRDTTQPRVEIDYSAVHAGKVELLKRFMNVKFKAEQSGQIKVKPF